VAEPDLIEAEIALPATPGVLLPLRPGPARAIP
jgi:hypothetical protein